MVSSTEFAEPGGISSGTVRIAPRKEKRERSVPIRKVPQVEALLPRAVHEHRQVISAG